MNPGRSRVPALDVKAPRAVTSDRGAWQATSSEGTRMTIVPLDVR